GVAAGAAVWVIKLRDEPTAPVPPATASALPDPREAVKAYLDAAQSFLDERRFDPALEMVAKAADYKIDDPAVALRISSLRDKISDGAAAAKPGEAAAGSPAPVAAEAADAEETAAPAAAARRKTRGREVR